MEEEEEVQWSSSKGSVKATNIHFSGKKEALKVPWVEK